VRPVLIFDNLVCENSRWAWQTQRLEVINSKSKAGVHQNA
jgi:hypothetical protein